MSKAVILDRDGVINDNDRPVNHPEELILFADVADAIARLNRANYLVCVATNQGGVGLGYLSEQNLDEIHAHMIRQLTCQGAQIDGLRACVHAPNAGCDCRKPKPGMLLSLQAEYGFDPAASFMVGDRETDVEAGIAAGLRTVRIGHRKESSKASTIVSNLRQAVEWIVKQK